MNVGALEIEAERRTGFVLTMDDDEVLRVDLRGDGFGELRRGEYWREDAQAEKDGDEKAEGSSAEREVRGVGITSASIP